MFVLAEGLVPDDVEPCVALWVDAVRARDGEVDAPRVSERMLRVFDRPPVRFAVGREEETPGALRGFAVTVPHPSSPRTAVLERIAVSSDMAGRGLGRLLLTDAVDASRARGFSSIELAVRAGNAAVRLYEAAGFRPVSAPEPHPLGGAPMTRYRLGL